jgi:OOP family OmpA-OmpF porin
MQTAFEKSEGERLQNSAADNENGSQGDRLNELRRLLLAPEKTQLSQLENQVVELKGQVDNPPALQPEEVSEVLPEAIIHRSQIDDQLSKATIPLTEENIRTSVRRNPQVLADALFPVIGPAIRKAIADALQTMVQSMNKTLEQSLSPQSIGWRLEALRTGKSFGEVVLLKTLLFRVEQVYLIHQKTGLVLQHVESDKTGAQDPEMVSAMLTAIQDFVGDSFQNAPGAKLDTLEVGELAVWIESGPLASLAAVIRGNAPLSFRDVLKERIEEIHSRQGNDLAAFSGNPDVFESSRPLLHDCLLQQLGTAEKKKKPRLSPVAAIGFGAAILLQISAFFWIRDHHRWSEYVERLKSEPGIVVTEAERGWRQHSVAGLRDLAAVDPAALLGDYSYETDDVAQKWQPYQSLDDKFILDRAQKILEPPPGVTLSFENGTLTVHGVAPYDWSRDAKLKVAALPGIEEFRTDVK